MLMSGSIVAAGGDGRLTAAAWRPSLTGAPSTSQACLLYSGGELHVVEYGVNEAVARLRTEHASPYLLSVAIQVPGRGESLLPTDTMSLSCQIAVRAQATHA